MLVASSASMRGCRRPALSVSLAALVLVVACAPGSGSLTVQLVSDMTPGVELDRARAMLARSDGTDLGTPVEVSLAAGRSLGRPTRLALFSAIAADDYVLTVEVARGGRTVQSRALRVRVEGDVVRTVLLTRDCGGVSCPGGADPSAVACLGGRCVDPHCAPEDPTSCGTPECSADADCGPGPVDCAPRRCTAGTCVATPDDALCTGGASCDAIVGCVAPTTRCDWSTLPTFTAPEIVLDLPVAESGLAFSLDALDLYFSEEIAPSARAYTSHRASLDAPFETPRTLDELHVAGNLESSFAFRRDGLEVILTSMPLGTAPTLSDVFVRTRTRVSDPWGAPTALAALNTPGYEFDAWLEPDGLTLWLERQGTADSEADVYRTHRARFEDPFEAPVGVDGLSMPGRIEANPTLPEDGSFVVVTTDQPGGGTDLAYARILDGVVGGLVPLDGVNGSSADSEPLVRADGCELLFVSRRAGMGGAAVYRVTVVP